MLSLPLPVRIFLCTEAADLRRSFDGLSFKRLEEGTFRFPLATPARGQSNGASAGVEIRATDLAMLLHGVDLESVRRRKRYGQPAAR